jgi:hypothetical protein
MIISPTFPPMPGRARDLLARFGARLVADGRLAGADLLRPADFFDAADFLLFLTEDLDFFARDAFRFAMNRV